MRMIAKLLLGSPLLVCLGCSVFAIREDACGSDSDCSELFGFGSTCDASGACVAPPDDCAAGEACGVVELADACGSDDVPAVEASGTFVLVDTQDLRNDFEDLGSCLDERPVGNDGFVAVDMVAGERWHFHVKTRDDESNPAVYVLSACDERACQPGDALDACGPGFDEHVSYEAATTGRRFLGIDDADGGGQGGEFELLVARPVCGSGGMPEHSETCDDGNLINADGCDDQCRAELTASDPIEVEPNDDRWGANVVLVDPKTSTLTAEGRIGGRCDFDTFAISVPADGTLVAIMSDASGQPCGMAPPISLQLLADDGLRVIAEGKLPEGSACPELGEAGLGAGEYLVRVSTTDEEAPFDYRLQLTAL